MNSSATSKNNLKKKTSKNSTKKSSWPVKPIWNHLNNWTKRTLRPSKKPSGNTKEYQLQTICPALEIYPLENLKLWTIWKVMVNYWWEVRTKMVYKMSLIFRVTLETEKKHYGAKKTNLASSRITTYTKREIPQDLASWKTCKYQQRKIKSCL